MVAIIVAGRTVMDQPLIYRTSPEQVKCVSNRMGLWIFIAIIVQSLIIARFSAVYSPENGALDYGLLYAMIPVSLFFGVLMSRIYRLGRLREQFILDKDRITIRNFSKTRSLLLDNLQRMTVRTNPTGEFATIHLHAGLLKGMRFELVDQVESFLEEIRARIPHVNVMIKRRRITYSSHVYFAVVLGAYLIGVGSLIYAAVYI